MNFLVRWGFQICTTFKKLLCPFLNKIDVLFLCFSKTPLSVRMFWFFDFLPSQFLFYLVKTTDLWIEHFGIHRFLNKSETNKKSSLANVDQGWCSFADIWNFQHQAWNWRTLQDKVEVIVKFCGLLANSFCSV